MKRGAPGLPKANGAQLEGRGDDRSARSTSVGSAAITPNASRSHLPRNAFKRRHRLALIGKIEFYLILLGGCSSIGHWVRGEQAHV